MNGLADKRLAVIGAGNIGRILLTRLAAAGLGGASLLVCDADPQRAAAAAAEFAVTLTTLSSQALVDAALLLIATPPTAVTGVLLALADGLRAGQVLVSFAAAVPLARLEALAPPGVAVARVMPNAPSLVGRGINPVAYGRSVTPAARELIAAVLATLGDTVEVRDDQMNWCVGLSGAAMRSLLPALEGMTQAGFDAGLPPETARKVAAQVMLGSAALALQTDLTYDALKGLTPMQTVNEPELTQIFYKAARGAKAKTDSLQHKLWGAD